MKHILSMYLLHCLKPLAVLLLFEVQHLCLCSTLNLTTVFPTTVQTIQLATDHDSCAERCFNQEVDSAEIMISVHYDECMRNCTGRYQWPVNESKCPDKPIIELIDNNIPSTCAPPDQNINIAEVSARDNSDGRYYGYLYVSWHPCDVGIEHITGFHVTIHSRKMFEPECRNFVLTRPLTRHDENMVFSLITHHKVDDGVIYDVTIRALPMNKDKPVTKHTRTLSCEELNPNSCFCVNSIPPLPAPNVTVDGYTVTVSTRPALPCFRIREYDAKIGFKLPSYFIAENILSRPMKYSTKNRTLLSYTFNHVYDGKKNREYSASIVTQSRRSGYRSTESTKFKITPWMPPIPDVEVYHSGHVVVSFHVASDGYKIETYSIELFKLTIVNDVILVNKSLSVNEIKAEKAKDGVLEKEFFNLEPASYSVKIREVRVLPHSTTFNSSKWGPPKVFVVPPAFDLALVLGTTLPAIFAIIVLSFICCLYIWKKGLCKEMRHYLPDYFSLWLDSQTDFKPRRRTILLVWQNDFRSTKLQEKHQQIVRHFASYLSTICGLEVIVDLFETRAVASAKAEWIQDSCKRAEFVIFICPHFEYQREVPTCLSFIGDFSTMFRYLESSLGVENKSRFITALLPYSDIKSSSCTKYLMNMTHVFALMDDIEDLYFHIQEFSKANARVQRVVPNISNNGYLHTSQGRALVNGIQKFQKYLSSMTLIEETSLSSNDLEQNRQSNRDSRGDSALTDLSDRHLHSSNTSVDDDDDLMEHDLLISPPPASDVPIYHERDKVQPPPPLVNDPENEILLINNMSQPHQFSSCPYHDLPLNIVQSFTNSGLTNDAYRSSGLRSFRSSTTSDKSMKNFDSSSLHLSTRSLNTVDMQDATKIDKQHLLSSRSMECVYHTSRVSDSGFYAPRS